MTAKEHYDRHLGPIYSWMLGNFQDRVSEQQQFFSRHNVFPRDTGVALDLGAGHGIQSVALARLGFLVTAIDFSAELLEELKANRGGLAIHTVQHDILHFLQHYGERPEVVVCMGDTLTHLNNYADVEQMIARASRCIIPEGLLILSWRDLTNARAGTDRFMLVRSDDNRSLTCFLEFLTDHVMVHDILIEKNGDQWRQTVSAYPKLRIAPGSVAESLKKNQLVPIAEETIRGMHWLVARKLQPEVTQ